MTACSAQPCKRLVKARGYCNPHYMRFIRYGDARAGGRFRTDGRRGRAAAQLGDTRLSSTGYTLVFTATGWKLQHRVVMEEILGRRLYDGESAHHLNGVRTDNRPENLELWVRPQPTGVRVEDAVAWARQIIERYT